jgi:excisionase family DNA binding protein
MTKFAPSTEALTTREAADRLGVSMRTVQLWVERNILPAWKTPGGHRRIPADAVEQVAASQRAAYGRPLRMQPGGIEVLLVEDDAFQRELVGGMLEASLPNLRLRVAGDGYEGLIRAGQQTPDVLIVDIAMPGMDGLRMLRSLMANEDFAAMRIVVFSSLDPEEIAERGGLPDGVAFLQKPVLPADLIAAVFGEIPAHIVPTAPSALLDHEPPIAAPTNPASFVTAQS